jgi:hypothetical protein
MAQKKLTRKRNNHITETTEIAILKIINIYKKEKAWSMHVPLAACEACV